MSFDLPKLLLAMDRVLIQTGTINVEAFCHEHTISPDHFSELQSCYQQQLMLSGSDITYELGNIVVNGAFAGLYQHKKQSITTFIADITQSKRIDGIVTGLQQAIESQQAISMIYTSLSSGSNTREFVPHSMINNGTRLHVRGYDRKSEHFRDFVVNRISQIKTCVSPVPEYETIINDHQWNRVITLRIVPHPHNVRVTTGVEMEYDMVDGCREINLRAALVGYLLRQWNVDSSENAVLRGEEYQLWLQNRGQTFDTENMIIAPGFQLNH